MVVVINDGPLIVVEVEYVPDLLKPPSSYI